MIARTHSDRVTDRSRAAACIHVGIVLVISLSAVSGAAAIFKMEGTAEAIDLRASKPLNDIAEIYVYRP